jgi:signal transduction histidine kinase
MTRWEGVLGNVDSVRTAVLHEAWRGLPVPAVFRGRRWPAVAAFAAWVGLAAFVMASGTALPAMMVLLGLAAYLVASRLPRRLSVLAVAVAAGALGGGLLYAASAAKGAPVAVKAIEGFLPLAAAWFAGDATAARRRYLAGLAEQAERERASEAERARQQVRAERVRIARELHDVVAHALAVVTVQAGVGRRLMARRPEEASCALESIEMIGRTAQEELRVVLGLLREEGTGDPGLSPVPRLADLKELAETVRASGTPVELLMADIGHRLSPALELTVYRVVQEALTNVVKHAPDARATVDVALSGTDIRIEVTDDGNPVGPGGRPEIAAGHGIVGMRERVTAFGGSLAAGPCPGGGFRVLAEVPAGAGR